MPISTMFQSLLLLGEAGGSRGTNKLGYLTDKSYRIPCGMTTFFFFSTKLNANLNHFKFKSTT